MLETPHIIKYAVRNNKIKLWGIGVVSILIVFWLCTNGPAVTSFFEMIKNHDPKIFALLNSFVSFIIFVVAILVGWEVARHQWKESLPKRLHVTYIGPEGRVLMKCNDADLGGEHDIRAFCQTTGSQMLEKEQLEFDPYCLKRETEKISENKRAKEYHVTFILRTTPVYIEAGVKAGKKLPKVWSRNQDGTLHDSWA